LSEKSRIDADPPLTSQQVKANVARALIAALTSECKAFCILSGYEDLPELFETDIDFMVNDDDFSHMPGIIDQVARRTQARLFLAVDHEITGRAYWLACQSGASLAIVQPDSTADYRHFGLLWLRSNEVLAARRWYARGFWIPAAAHEFAYCLVKRLNKRTFKPEHGRKLHRLYVEDPSGCDQIITRFWKGSRRALLSRMAVSDDWAAMGAELEALRKEMRRNTAESLWQRAASAPRRLRAFLKRIVHPTGGWIAIMGPDGAGKSLVIGALRQQLSSVFRTVQCFHLRPKLLRRVGPAEAVVTDPHGKPARGRLVSIAKVFFMLADYLLGYLFKLAPAMMRSDMIIFDRYIYDLLVDSKRVRYGGPLWLLRLAARIVPRPDLVILLDAPAEVLWSRKQEVAFEEVVRQRERYLQVVSELPSAVVIDAAQSPSDVAGSVVSAIVEFYAERTASRLALDAASVSRNPIKAEATSHQC
jgi:thymidylate kinase